MRSFKVDGRVFIGFDQNFESEHDLLLVQNEDSIEAYAFDKGVDERILIMDDFLRMLDLIDSQAKIIGFYSEQGFRGVKFCDNSMIWSKSRFS